MRAREIAETLINGNISEARREITNGRTQTEAAVMALDVLDELLDAFGIDPGAGAEMQIARLRRCLQGGE